MAAGRRFFSREAGIGELAAPFAVRIESQIGFGQFFVYWLYSVRRTGIGEKSVLPGNEFSLAVGMPPESIPSWRRNILPLRRSCCFLPRAKWRIKKGPMCCEGLDL